MSLIPRTSSTQLTDFTSQLSLQRFRRARLEREIVRSGTELLIRGLVIASTGNISARWGPGFLVTPSRRPYHRLRRRDVILVDAEGAPVCRGSVPSRGATLHAEIYRRRPDVNAIVHHHGPYATAWSLLERQLAPRLEEARYFDIGSVCVIGSHTYGSRAFIEECGQALLQSKAVLLTGHGVIALGNDVSGAMAVAVAVEHEAQVAWMCNLAGSFAAS